MRVIGIILAMIAGTPAVFIAQLYSPAIMWALSFALFFAVPLIAFLEIRWARIIGCAAVSVVINSNYLLHVPYGNPAYELAIYSVALLIFDFALVAVIVNLTRSLLKSRGNLPNL